MKPLTYIASPYSHPDWGVRYLRFQAASQFAAKLTREGRHVFSPIAHSHPVAVFGGIDGGFEFWREWCVNLLDRCDDVIVLQLDGWMESVGVAHEIAYATAKGLPIRYVEWEQ